LQQSKGTSRRYRQWIGLFVVGAAVVILAAKAYGPHTRAVADPFEASVLAADADVDPSEPWPSSPSEQAQWALRHEQPAMILFYSTLCRPCRMMEALVQMVKRDYQPDVVFIEVLYDDPANAEVLRWAKIGTIPASYFLTRLGEGERVIGLMKQADLRAELARIAAAAQD
jgi:thiol-disulfide isomerase/thioredoxin